jgi:hypothetical protein
MVIASGVAMTGLDGKGKVGEVGKVGKVDEVVEVGKVDEVVEVGKVDEVGKVGDDLVLKGCLSTELSAGVRVDEFSGVIRCLFARSGARTLYGFVGRSPP